MHTEQGVRMHSLFMLFLKCMGFVLGFQYFCRGNVEDPYYCIFLMLWRYGRVFLISMVMLQNFHYWLDFCSFCYWYLKVFWRKRISVQVWKWNIPFKTDAQWNIPFKMDAQVKKIMHIDHHNAEDTLNSVC